MEEIEFGLPALLFRRRIAVVCAGDAIGAEVTDIRLSWLPMCVYVQVSTGRCYKARNEK